LNKREGGVFQNVDPFGGGTSPGSATPWAPGLALIGFVGLCLLVDASNAAITAGSGAWYASLTAPPGTPPSWLFAPVWTMLYVLMGLAAWLVWRKPGHRRPLLLWGWQLLVNALWSPAFFGFHRPLLALGVVIVLVVLICLTTAAFARRRKIAALLMLPYLLWTCYATYLSAGFWWLNSGLG
jgi:tryptophan-rich sensory protein